MTPQTALLVVWAAFAAASVLAGSAVLLWAVRTRQFSNQDRLRYLPLICDKPDPDPRPPA